MTKKLFTTKEIMNLLGLAQPTISKYVKKGMPVAGKVDFGKGNVYDLKDVTDWIKENAKPTGRPKKEEVVMVDDLPFTDYEEADELPFVDIDEPIENLGLGLQDLWNQIVSGKKQVAQKTPYNEFPIQPKVFKHRDMPVYVREDLHDKVKREALRHNVTMKKLVEDIVAYHLEVKV